MSLSLGHKYDWAYRWHFIDGKGNENGKDCSIDMERDCLLGEGKGCVVSAIRNYTQRVQVGLVKDRQEALMFLTHFIGDIHQPLHTCGLYRGGNDYK